MSTLRTLRIGERGGERVEVWAESESIAGVLREVCRDARVSPYPPPGFPSRTLCWEAAQSVLAMRTIRTLTVYYVGDRDPSGLLIDDTLREHLGSHLAQGGVDLRFTRLAVTLDQVRRLDLPEKPRKATERRRPAIGMTDEAAAIPAAYLRAVVRDAVESHLPERTLDVVRVIERSEREGLRRLADALKVRRLDANAAARAVERAGGARGA